MSAAIIFPAGVGYRKTPWEIDDDRRAGKHSTPAQAGFIREGLPSPPEAGSFRSRPRLSDRVRQASRLRHLSARTEEAYLGWIRRYFLFHGRRDPAVLGAEHVTAFLNDLATRRGVAASTQNQALAALLFLYRDPLP